jgi:hypothetical protein
MRYVVLLMAVVLAGSAGAQEWRALLGPEIATALTGRTLKYETATQDFRTSGRTLYIAGGPSWGNWRVAGDQYCSQWPPGDAWACYDLQVDQSGLRLRFVSASGSITEGRYDDPQ